MAAFVLLHEFGKFLGNGTIDLDTHTFKAALTNSAPTQGTNTVLTDITQISATRRRRMSLSGTLIVALRRPYRTARQGLLP
jgi:hypothetical protein